MSTNLANSGCDLCGGGDFEKVSDRDRRGKPLQTVLCRGCGLVQHAQIPSDQELAEFYGKHYRESYHGETAPSDRRVMRAWNSAERIYGRLRTHLNAEARIVEVGAGIGCTVRRFQTAGYKSWGLEPHEGFCHYGRRELGAELRNQELADVSPEGDHELALLIHVIEHFNSPLRSLRRIREMLTENGMLYVECPNLSAPFARLKKMFHFAHIHSFSPLTLVSLAERSGFRLQHAFSTPRSANLEFLFRRCDDVSWEVNPAGYQEARRGLARATGLRYYLRSEYWQRRTERLTSYAAEFVRASARVAGLRDAANDPASKPASSSGPVESIEKPTASATAESESDLGPTILPFPTAAAERIDGWPERVGQRRAA